MSRDTIRLRILELALTHGNSTDKVRVAEDFAEFVFDQEPKRIRPLLATFTGTARLRNFSPTRKKAKARNAKYFGQTPAKKKRR